MFLFAPRRRRRPNPAGRGGGAAAADQWEERRQAPGIFHSARPCKRSGGAPFPAMDGAAPFIQLGPHPRPPNDKIGVERQIFSSRWILLSEKGNNARSQQHATSYPAWRESTTWPKANKNMISVLVKAGRPAL